MSLLDFNQGFLLSLTFIQRLESHFWLLDFIFDQVSQTLFLVSFLYFSFDFSIKSHSWLIFYLTSLLINKKKTSFLAILFF